MTGSYSSLAPSNDRNFFLDWMLFLISFIHQPSEHAEVLFTTIFIINTLLYIDIDVSFCAYMNFYN